MKTTVLTVTEKNMFQETELISKTEIQISSKGPCLWLSWSFGVVLHLIGATSDPQTELQKWKKTLYVYATPRKAKVRKRKTTQFGPYESFGLPMGSSSLQILGQIA